MIPTGTIEFSSALVSLFTENDTISESMFITHRGLNSITPSSLPVFELTAVSDIFFKYCVVVYVVGSVVDHVVPL
jgi:hypothetical protein